jgi:glycine hydroxymethyltransferase
MDTPLREDSELFEILKKETVRQKCSLELIASENYTSCAVLEANGSIFTNKYSEGYVGRRYYGGNEHIDELETLCKQRALAAFGLDPEIWGVNVQAYSGSPANFAVYTALLRPGDRLMGLDLPAGGHLTHGYYTTQRAISASSIYFQSLPYTVDDEGRIDYYGLERDAARFKPKLIIAGASAYTRDIDYAWFRAIADKNKSYLMADIAHTAGLIASGVLTSPFQYCDVVTTTTHKTLRGPRGALIFYKKAHKEAIDFAVFPSCQGGPHNNTIAAIATALKQVHTEEFKLYAKQVVENAQHLAAELKKRGFVLVTGGTDNHIVLVNIRANGLTGSQFEYVAELCSISVNKNTIPGDTSALSPSGIRIGTPAMTTRGFSADDFSFVADILLEVSELSKKIADSSESKTFAEFKKSCGTFMTEIATLRTKVTSYCEKFPYFTL